MCFQKESLKREDQPWMCIVLSARAGSRTEEEKGNWVAKCISLFPEQRQGGSSCPMLHTSPKDILPLELKATINPSLFKSLLSDILVPTTTKVTNGKLQQILCRVRRDFHLSDSEGRKTTNKFLYYRLYSWLHHSRDRQIGTGQVGVCYVYLNWQEIRK